MKNEKIEDLTPEQEEKLESYYEKWLRIGLSTEPTTTKMRDAAERAVMNLYIANDLKVPEIVWARSPDEAIRKIVEIGGDEKIKEEPLNAAGFGQHDANWLGFYDFMRNELGLKEETEDVLSLMVLAENCGWWWPYENICILSERPISMSLNQNGDLHNLNAPALEYSDGFPVYCIEGVLMPDWVVETSAEKMDIEKILALPNVEHRLLAIKKFGAHNMISQLNGKVISSKGQEYELYEIDLEGQKEKLLKMKNPSEEKWHFEFVTPEIRTVDEALAWRIGFDMKQYKEPVAKT